MTIKNNVSEIRRLLAKRKGSMHKAIRFLVSRGISQALAEEMTLGLHEEGKEIFQLREQIIKRLRTTGELSFKESHQLALVGPTGVGKTTTLMRLALAYLKLNKQVAVMSLDEAKKKFLAKWAEAHKISFFEKREDAHYDLLLIDTEGCNFYQPGRVEKLGEKLEAHLGSTDVLLTLSASAKEVDLYGAIHQFSTLGPTSLVFTKLDETLAAGALVNVCAKTDLPIRYISFGYPLPGEVQLADSKTITHKILTDFNQEEFQLLRQL